MKGCGNELTEPVPVGTHRWGWTGLTSSTVYCWSIGNSQVLGEGRHSIQLYRHWRAHHILMLVQTQDQVDSSH